MEFLTTCVPNAEPIRFPNPAGPLPHSPGWACYHTDLYEFDFGAERFGIIGCAVGASFAVLVAEELFASGCKMLISMTSAGQIAPAIRNMPGTALPP